MKIQNYILILLTAFSCAMCNSPKKDKEEAIAAEKTSNAENDKHPVLTPADSLKW